MAGIADALKVGVAVVVTRDDVIDLGRRSLTADAADRIAVEDAAADLRPSPRQSPAPRAPGPWLRRMVRTGLEVGAARLRADA